MRFGSRREDSAPLSDHMAVSDQDDEPRYEYILKEMYVPPGSEGSFNDRKDVVDLVFVHGLGGNLKTTWKQEGTTEPWFTKPEFLGRLKDSIRVLSFGYNAQRFGDVANTRIIHHANDLLRNLVLKRLDHPDRPLIFIAHSLGGLVVKRAILLCATNDDWKAIKQATKSIIFMGTPHMGSEKAEDLVVVQKLASLIKFQTAIATNLTKELRTFSTAVQDINMEFTIDRLPNGTKEIIVPQWSAVLQGVENIDLNCTHSGLPKFASPSHPRFELFWGEIQRLVRLAKSPQIKPLKKAPTWTDEEALKATPPRSRQTAQPRRRHEVSIKGSKSSRDSIIRSSVDKLLKEVTNRMNVDMPAQKEMTVSQSQSQEQLEKIDPKEFNDFVRILRPVTPENKGLDREAPHWQTCSWILKDPTFLEWKENMNGSLLFITGSPGCGKSNLAKYIQGVMKKPSEETPEENLVISFYCDSLESSRHNPPILDLAVQSLLNKHATISQVVIKKLQSLSETLGVDRQKMREPVDIESDGRFIQLMEIIQLLATAKDAMPACLIIDGLDQCEDEFILRLLRGLDMIFRRGRSPSALKVVITSRMADSIRGFALSNHHIEITPDLIVHDIQRVVDEEVDRIILSRQIATVGRTSVSAVIVERSNGSFLFASSVLKELWYIKDTGANSVFTLVTSCPSTMEAIYQQDMERLREDRYDLFQLVQIICIARRTLRIQEVKEVLRLLNPEVTRTYDLVGELTRTCQRLVRFGGEDTLELLHQTLYDFIINTYDLKEIHKSLADICLNYLIEMDWEQYTDTWTVDSREIMARRYPLLNYASTWMRHHWKHVGIDDRPRSGSPSAVRSSPPPFQNFSRQSGGSTITRRMSESSGDGADSRATSSHESRERLLIEDRSVIRTAKPPLVLLAQWDADIAIRELFFEAFESSPRQVLNRALGLIPYISSQSNRNTQKEFKEMANHVWEGTTALHYAAAQSGKALEMILPFVDDINFPDGEGATPLILAATTGERRGVLALLESGADVDAVDAWNQTALFYAVDACSGDVVRTLLEHGADPDIPSNTGHSPLEVAIGLNNSEVAKILLEFAPDLNAPTTTGHPPAFLASWLGSTDVLETLIPYIDVDQIWNAERLIHRACFRGWGNVVDKLISRHANLHDPPKDTPKATPVALAAERGHNDVLRALLAAGAAVECPVPLMSSPLHIAAASRNLLACELLLRAGGYINARTEDGSTALSVAADLNSVEVVECLVSHGADPNRPDYERPLHIAADWGNLEMVQVILSGRSFPQIDAKDESNFTALGIAASAGRLDIVSILLDHGADPNLRNGRRNSSSPLHLAASKGHRSVMIELLKRGAGPYPESTKESSPFHTACGAGWLDVMGTFFEVVDDADELVNFEWGWSGIPLRSAASGGKLDAVKLLLSKGADPNYKLKSKVNNGQTVIHAAAEGGNTEAFEAIFDAAVNSSLEVCDLEQRTPLWYACAEGREDMVKYLLEKGASTEVVIANGETIIPVIVIGGSEKILKLVLERNPNLDTDCLGENGETPLFSAVTFGYDRIASILLERGANVNRKSKDGNVPIFGAIYYRQNKMLQMLLEHEHIDLTQRDFYDRGVLQMAQVSGHPSMAAMVLGATKDLHTERVLTENRDVFGLNSYDRIRLDANPAPTFEYCVEAVLQDAQDLLDDFEPRGLRWERLGKFLLQLKAYSFVQIALQRSIRVVETAPLLLEHENYCDMCLETIVGTRYVCCTCCTMDFCEWCARRYPEPGSGSWPCQYHSFYAIILPNHELSKEAVAKKAIDFKEASRLSLIEEEDSDGSDDETKASESDNGCPQQPIRQDFEQGLGNDKVSLCPTDTSNGCAMVVEPSAELSTPETGGSYFEDGVATSAASSKVDTSVNEQWIERTEDELREFLDAILKTFTTDKTHDDRAKWTFAADSWKLTYNHQGRVLSEAEEDENPLMLRPALRWTPPKPYTDAYYYLSGLAYIIANVPLRLAATGLLFSGPEREASRKRRRLQRLTRKVIIPGKRDGEVTVRGSIVSEVKITYTEHFPHHKTFPEHIIPSHHPITRKRKQLFALVLKANAYREQENISVCVERQLFAMDNNYAAINDASPYQQVRLEGEYLQPARPEVFHPPDANLPYRLCIACKERHRSDNGYYCSPCHYTSDEWNQCNLCLRALPCVGNRGFCTRCLPLAPHETDPAPVSPNPTWENGTWENGRKDAIFLLTSFYRPLPQCFDCALFVERGIICPECDFVPGVYRGAFRHDYPRLAFQDGQARQPIHLHRGGIRLELPSVTNAGITMEWIEEQLKFEKQWSTEFPHALSPIAEAGIRFLMTCCPFSEDWDKMKTLIVVNKFLNGLVSGQMIRRDQQWLVCNPIPTPNNMPNLDYGLVPEGTKPPRPSAVLDPKENLREIFRELYNHVFRMRLADGMARGNDSWTESLSASHEWVAKWNPGGREMRTPLGCCVYRPDQRLFSHIIGAEIQEFCELNVYIRSQEDPNVLILLAKLTNAQMGQNPGVPFDQSPYHPFSRQRDGNGFPRRVPGEQGRSHEATMSNAPHSWKKKIADGRHSPDPPGDQITMLHHMDWQVKGALTSYDDGRYRFIQQPNQIRSFYHYAQLLLHTHGFNSVQSMSLPDGATYRMAQQLSFAPNFGDRIQDARAVYRTHGYIFDLDERTYAERRMYHHTLNMLTAPNLRQGQPREAQTPFIPPQQPVINGLTHGAQAPVPQQPHNTVHGGVQAGNGFIQPQRPNQAMNQQPVVNINANSALGFVSQPLANRPRNITQGAQAGNSFGQGSSNLNQTINPQSVQAPTHRQPASQPLNMVQRGGQAVNASSQAINHQESTNVIPNGAQAPVRQQPANQLLVSGNPSGTRVPINQQPARQPLNMTQTGGQSGDATSQTINQQQSTNLTLNTARAPVHGQNAGQRPNVMQGVQAGNAFVQGPNLNQTAIQQPPANVNPSGSQVSSYIQSNGKRLKLAQGEQQDNVSVQGSSLNIQPSVNEFHGSSQAPAHGPSGGRPQNTTQVPPQQSTSSFVPAREPDEQLLSQNQERALAPDQLAPTQTNFTSQGNTQVKQETRGNVKTEQEE
ncbi:hypothetical protein FSARC_5791 [Fusarium sarcochroum]|uniref:AAA+ ATPase domain-containing protein n=1 Tax=Fusarium sarcochroum TaxID=1208366 RepID=A0A8H4TZ18_9HYPO|nr:hypothetical protein FSARC_5791 [Fusarium sarcochroum]